MTHECPRHAPGSAVCYREHACRCTPCLAAGRAYTKRQENGQTSRVPADLARSHIGRLVRAGMSELAIARAAGVAQSTVLRIRAGAHQTTWRRTAQAILRVRPTGDLSGMVDALGTTRRLQSLAAIGLSSRAIADDTGLCETVVRRIRRGAQPTVSAATAATVRSYFDTAAARPPANPDVRLVNLARRKRWPVPMAWDDIDDPNARPHAGRDSKRDTAGELVHLIEGGEWCADNLAERLGITRGGVYVALRRAGRDDLIPRLTTREAVA